MIHLNDVDFAGHTTGFELDNKKYIEAIDLCLKTSEIEVIITSFISQILLVYFLRTFIFPLFSFRNVIDNWHY
jgi:hypothetical protein